VEILTYETEQDYDRLQELHRESQDKQPEPGKTTPLFLRSRSVQPFALTVPRDFSQSRNYPLVVQLHGLNFREVLSGSRVRYRGMGGPQWIEPPRRLSAEGLSRAHARGRGKLEAPRARRRAHHLHLSESGKPYTLCLGLADQAAERARSVALELDNAVDAAAPITCA